MSNNNWYSTDSWYAPLNTESAPKKARGVKRRRLSFGWRLGIGISLLVGLIVLSSILFSGSGSDTMVDFGIADMPEDWQEYFDSFYTEVESTQAETKLEKAEKITDFVLQLKKPAEAELSLQQLYEKCAKSTVSIMAYQGSQEQYYWGRRQKKNAKLNSYGRKLLFK